MPEAEESAATEIGPVDIRIPPVPSLIRVTRLAASGMASLMGYTVEEIEDIKIAISEVMIALIEHGDGAPVELSLRANSDEFLVLASTEAENLDLNHPDLVLCQTVLRGVCASHAIAVTNGRAQISASVSPMRHPD